MPNSSPVPRIVDSYEPYATPAYIWQYAIQDLEGRILTIVETLGLAERQEESLKSLLRQAIWRHWEEAYHIPRDIMDTMFQRTDIMQIKDWNRPVGSGVGPSAKKPKKR